METIAQFLIFPPQVGAEARVAVDTLDRLGLEIAAANLDHRARRHQAVNQSHRTGQAAPGGRPVDHYSFPRAPAWSRASRKYGVSGGCCTETPSAWCDVA